MEVHRDFRRKWVWLFLCVCLLAPARALASVPYEGYIFNKRGEEVHSLNGYLYYDSWDGFGTEAGALNAPEDLFVDRHDRLYVADTGNHRILMMDRDFRLLRVYGDADGPGRLNAPKGVYVDEEGVVYVADTNHKRIAVFAPDGAFLREIAEPKSTLLGDSFVYTPAKLIVDKRGYFFVVSQGATNGLLQLSGTGEFESFFGGNRVNFSWVRVFLRLFATREQRAQIVAERPLEISNLYQDREGFIYTTTLGGEFNQIKRLSPVGVDTLNQGRVRYGDRSYSGPFEVPSFVDVTVDDKGVITALDQNTNKAFQYDKLGNLLFVFGGTGEQNGLLKTAAAIGQTSDGTMYIVDQSRHRIDRFRPTPFGELVHRASALYVEGRYTEAESLWHEVLRYNGNYDMAYHAIGKSLYKAERYREAMDYFRLAHSKWDYSQAFKEYRKEWMRNRFEWLMAGVAALFLLLRYVAPYVFRKLRRYGMAREAGRPRGRGEIARDGEPG
jgi:DNA-binding beta-propeller fold protein YncE